MISFVVPCYNEEALLPACLESIIAEAFSKDHEIIVVDNGSTDNTAEVARCAGATVLVETRKGVTRARQAGLEAAQYELIAFVDADNEVPPGWLEDVLKSFNDPAVVAVSGPVVYSELLLPKRVISFLFYCVAKISHQFFPVLQGGNFIVRKSALLKAGGFNTDIEFYGEDTDTAVRLSKVGKVAFNLNLWVWSSARRMEREGMFLTGGRYILNYIWIWAVGKPWTAKYHDWRK